MGRIVFCLAALVVVPVAAQAQVYKCVEAGGKVVYSQAPCPQGARSTALSRTPAPWAAPAAPDSAKKSAAPAGPKTPAQLDEEFRKRRQEQADADKKSAQKQAQAQDKQDNCRAAKSQLASLEAGMRQVRVDENGERHFLNDEEIEQAKVRARRAVEGNCGS